MKRKQKSNSKFKSAVHNTAKFVTAVVLTANLMFLTSGCKTDKPVPKEDPKKKTELTEKKPQAAEKENAWPGPFILLQGGEMKSVTVSVKKDDAIHVKGKSKDVPLMVVLKMTNVDDEGIEFILGVERFMSERVAQKIKVGYGEAGLDNKLINKIKIEKGRNPGEANITLDMNPLNQ